MADIFEYLQQYKSIENEALSELERRIKTKSFKKDEYILKPGVTCKYLYFVDAGLVKSFFFKEDKEFIMRFFSENLMFSVFDSYFTQNPSKYALIALEDTTITFVSNDVMAGLCLKYHGVETFFRTLVSIATVKMMKRIGEMLEDNATERYKQFVEENNDILLRISLGDMAKYLGITQQSLSRIRAAK